MSRKEELDKYLKEEIHPILEPLVTELLLKAPRGAAVIPFCIEWLNKKNATNLVRTETRGVNSDDDMDEEE